MAQIISKERVVAHGEVFTREEEVSGMLDLVKSETERIDSRFLEPACGTGNFLQEILQRKLDVVERRYHKHQFDYERQAVIAVSSIYGIDILADNVKACRKRIYSVFNERYTKLYSNDCNDSCRASVRHILELNITHGDALTLKKVDKDEPIIFPEWSALNGKFLKRRDFAFEDLLIHQEIAGLPLFSDLGEEVFIPTPKQEYPPVHFLELAHE